MSMKKYLIYTSIFLLVVIISFLVWKNAKNDRVVLVSEEMNPLKIIDCEYAPNFQYWSYWEKDFDFEKNSWEDQRRKKQGNFYISCESEGTAKMINAYVFKDYKLFFKKENIYRGRFFEADGNFYIVQGIMNPEANAYPLGYALTKYEFDSLKNELAEKETREYQTKKELDDFCNLINKQ